MTGIHCPFQLGYVASAAFAVSIVINGASASAAASPTIALRRERWSTMMISLRSGTAGDVQNRGSMRILSHLLSKSRLFERAEIPDTHSGTARRQCLPLRMANAAGINHQIIGAS